MTPPTTDTDSPRTARRVAWLGVSLVLVLLAVLSLHLVRDGVERAAVRMGAGAPTVREDSLDLARSLQRLERRIEATRPSGSYLVVSSTDNRFALMRGADTLRAGLCSTGSYVHLTSGDGRSWLFTTPRGRRTVLDKRVRPVWAKPDWAFI